LKLQFRYTATATILVSLVVLILSVILFLEFSHVSKQMAHLTSETMSRHLSDEIKERANSSTQFLSVHIDNALYLHDMEEMENVITRTKKLPNVEFVYIYDSSLNIVHDGTSTIENYGKNLHSSIPILFNHNWNAGDSGYIIEKETLVSYRPIYFGEDLIGGVSIVLSLREMLESVKSMQQTLSKTATEGKSHIAYNVAISAIFFIAASFLVAYFIAEMLVVPINKLRMFATHWAVKPKAI